MFNLGSKNHQRVPPSKSSIGISPACREFVRKLSRSVPCKTSLLKIQTDGKKSSCSTKYLPRRIHGTGIFTYTYTASFPLKNGGWKTSLSYWEGTFSGENSLLNFRGCNMTMENKNTMNQG